MALAYDANITKVEVTGRAGDLTQKARRHALEDALYLAALKAGADISGTAITTKGVLVRDIVKLDARGRLVDFNILSEKNTGTHYEVNLRAFLLKTHSILPKAKIPKRHNYGTTPKSIIKCRCGLYAHCSFSGKANH